MSNIVKHTLCILAVLTTLEASALTKKDSYVLANYLHYNIDTDRAFLGYEQSWEAGYPLYPEASLAISNDSIYHLHVGLRYFWKAFSIAFGPGYYHKGDGVDLGGNLQFKTDLSWSINPKWRIAYYHISNAGLENTNPGADGISLSYNLSARR